MAKKQTFGDKANRGKQVAEKRIKLVKTRRSDKTNSLRFSHEMIPLKDGKSPEQIVKEAIKK